VILRFFFLIEEILSVPFLLAAVCTLLVVTRAGFFFCVLRSFFLFLSMTPTGTFKVFRFLFFPLPQEEKRFVGLFVLQSWTGPVTSEHCRGFGSAIPFKYCFGCGFFPDILLSYFFLVISP